MGWRLHWQELSITLGKSQKSLRYVPCCMLSANLEFQHPFSWLFSYLHSLSLRFSLPPIFVHLQLPPKNFMLCHTLWGFLCPSFITESSKCKVTVLQLEDRTQTWFLWHKMLSKHGIGSWRAVHIWMKWFEVVKLIEDGNLFHYWLGELLIKVVVFAMIKYFFCLIAG
jgi:hypothetical protein